MYGCMSIQVVFYYLSFYFLFEELFFLSKVLLIFFFQSTCYVIYHNFPGINCLLSRCGEDEKLVQMACFVLKTQGVLMYNVNNPVDQIPSYRALFPV